ncbi:MAG TPA: selenocysteine-specific translation elongation factor [Anaerolineaceae bacterium]|nr:selenocysteine-specific translation elongation factor [Anaerolineaceae bacterium]
MRVIGTAGHVDHGKSTLIAALTGSHPDRLKEERDREMTIDLGFAWLELANGETIGIVDVPGHRDFIENMLAGVGGIDAALFVVAADEGVMPQTREHLAILDLLQISNGVIALTKADLIDDPEWFDLVEAEVRQAIQGTVLENAPLVRVSAKTRMGLPALVEALARQLEAQPARPDLGRPRLPIDRVFTMSGFGTVVTGTLTDGQFYLGDEVEVLPSGLHGRVRGLQIHNRMVKVAVPGSRTAINIAGLNVDQIHRGDVVASPEKYLPTRRLDVDFRLLSSVETSLKHNAEVKLFLGTAEVIARTRVLGGEELLPGQSGWLQLELRDPVVALRGDRFILRRPSPGETLGGGEVVDPQPGERHKRFSEEVLARLQDLRGGSPAEVLFQASLVSGLAPLGEVVQKARLETAQAESAAEELISKGDLLALDGEGKDLLVIALPQWNALRGQVLEVVKAYHQSYPLRQGIPREELKSRLKMQNRPFLAAMHRLIARGDLMEKGALLSLADHQVVFNPQQEQVYRAVLARFTQAPYSPPSLKEVQAELGEELVNALLARGDLIQVSPEVVFFNRDYAALVEGVKGYLQDHLTLTVAEFRDRYQTSRKYALAFLEHLDSIGVTVRVGDDRRLK